MDRAVMEFDQVAEKDPGVVPSSLVGLVDVTVPLLNLVSRLVVELPRLRGIQLAP